MHWWYSGTAATLWAGISSHQRRGTVTVWTRRRSRGSLWQSERSCRTTHWWCRKARPPIHCCHQLVQVCCILSHLLPSTHPGVLHTYSPAATNVSQVCYILSHLLPLTHPGVLHTFSPAATNSSRCVTYFLTCFHWLIQVCCILSHLLPPTHPGVLHTFTRIEFIHSFNHS